MLIIIFVMLTAKEINEARQQIRGEIEDLDRQIHELETFYIEDTKEAVLVMRVRETF
jgi:prefoldin subunit 5